MQRHTGSQAVVRDHLFFYDEGLFVSREYADTHLALKDPKTQLNR